MSSMLMDNEEESNSAILDVAIVGGGIGGTYSAYRLRKTNQRIALFECSNRIGGRIFSHSPNEFPELRIELGAMRFFEKEHSRMTSLCHELGLTVIPFVESTNANRVYLRGQHISHRDLFHGDIPFELTEDENAHRDALIVYYFERLTGVPFEGEKTCKMLLDNMICTVDGTPLHQLSFEQALDKVASPDGKAFFQSAVMFNSKVLLANRSNQFFARILHRNWFVIKETHYVVTVAEGMAAIPQRMARVFEEYNKRHSLHMNKSLKSIRKRSDDLYELGFAQTSASSKGNTISTRGKDLSYVVAKQVILAIPVTALEKIIWSPPQTEVIQQIKATSVELPLCKIYLFFNTPWWRQAANLPVNSKTDLSYSESIDFGSKKGVYILLAYTKGEMVHQLHNIQHSGLNASFSGDNDNTNNNDDDDDDGGDDDDDDAMQVTTPMKDFLLDQLALTFNTPRKDIPEPVGGVIKIWNEQPGCVIAKSVLDPLEWNTSRLVSPLNDMERVFVVGSDVAVDSNHTVWAEGALTVVDHVLMKYNFVS